MQRLFSMFPRGRAGVALLLLRLAVGVAIFLAAQLAPGGMTSTWLVTSTSLCAISMCIGLFTPAAALAYVTLVALAWLAQQEAVTLLRSCTVVHAVVLALLGPGGYSIDARLFGRKQIIVSNHDHGEGA